MSEQSASRNSEASKSDKDERAALIRRLREGQCADNMGCGTMKMCVCANATDAADYLEKLAAVPELGTLLKVDERDPNHRECQRQDAAFVHRIANLQSELKRKEEERAKQHQAACDATAEAIYWKKVAQGESPFVAVSGCGTSTEGRSNAGAESPTVIRENAPSAPSTLSASQPLPPVVAKENVLELARWWNERPDSFGPDHISMVGLKMLTGELLRLAEVRSTRQPSDFTLDVCEALFGCFLDDGYEDDPHGTFRCGQCHEPIKITEWVNATHASSCIINKVRNVLREHRPAAAPLSATGTRSECAGK